MLPGPGTITLIVAIAGERGHQRALAAVRAQPHIDVVETAGAGFGAQQCHHLLRKPRKPAPGFQRSLAIGGFHLAWVIVEKHQIQIRAEAQLQAAQTAIADDGERAARHLPMRGDQFAARQLQHRLHHGLGKPGQLLGTVHGLLATIERGQCNAEVQREPALVEFAQGRFGIVDLQGVDACGMQCGAVGQRTADAGVEQFVQQQRMRRQALGQQGAAREHIDQACERAGLFVQQRQIAGAAQGGLQQAEHAAHGGIGLAGACGRMQQRRHHAVEPRAGSIGERTHAGGLRKIDQHLMRAGWIVQADACQRRGIAFR